MARKKTPIDEDPPFEAALGELEALVDELEAGDLNLAESLQKFERGVTLARQCQASLSQAEQKIHTLSEATDDGDAATETKRID